MARSFQVPVTFEDMSVADNVMVGAFLRHPHRTDARRAAADVLAFTGLAPLADTPRPDRWARPAASGWRSPARWPPSLACCCWTRRWRD